MAHRHLFLDLQEVTAIDNLHRRLIQPERHPSNPVLRCEHPWEDRASLYGTVLYDAEARLFRMYYLTGPGRSGTVQVRGRTALANITLLGYATSVDGVHWDKPFLGQLDYEGSTANNLIDVGRTNCEGFAVLDDPQAAGSDRRFKAFYWEHGGVDTFVRHTDGRLLWGEGDGDGMWMSYSPDGVHWTNEARNPVIALGSDTTQSLLWDEQRAEYVVFGRMGSGGRRVARAASADGHTFGPPELVLAPDAQDEPGTQFYGMPVCLYEGLYLGMLWVYREGVDGTIDTALAVSRDGFHWERVLDRQTFLPLGPPGSWEDGMARISQQFVVRGDRVYLYYGGVQGPHTGSKFQQVTRTHKPEIGLALLRRDGFVALEAGAAPGALLTKPLVVTGSTVHVNAATDAGGWITVELTDDRGQPLPGYTAPPLTGDGTDLQVSFERPLERVAGQQLRLRFRLQRARLFAYWFA